MAKSDTTTTSTSSSTETSTDTTSSIPKPYFKIGEIIGGSWKVIGELGSGGCGIVYEVERFRGNRCGIHAALKAETVDSKKKYSETLVAEALVLRRMQWSPHFCRLYLAGRSSPNCNIIVMSLVGRPLSWLRRQNPSQRFTLSTALRLGIQCLEAIIHLHSIGFIHRDVKGSNFAIGRGAYSHIVHMIDFGFARLYLDIGEDGRAYHRVPRSKAPYLGTDRYCSAFVHMHKEQGRRDDLWSFLYMLVEFVVGELPWRNSPYKKLLDMKSKSPDRLLKKCPHEFFKIYDHIRFLEYDHRPNYDLVHSVLLEICNRKKISMSEPFDWEKGGRYHYEYLQSVKKEHEKKNTEQKDIEKEYVARQKSDRNGTKLTATHHSRNIKIRVVDRSQNDNGNKVFIKKEPFVAKHGKNTFITENEELSPISDDLLNPKRRIQSNLSPIGLD